MTTAARDSNEALKAMVNFQTIRTSLSRQWIRVGAWWCMAWLCVSCQQVSPVDTSPHRLDRKVDASHDDQITQIDAMRLPPDDIANAPSNYTAHGPDMLYLPKEWVDREFPGGSVFYRRETHGNIISSIDLSDPLLSLSHFRSSMGELLIATHPTRSPLESERRLRYTSYHISAPGLMNVRGKSPVTIWTSDGKLLTSFFGREEWILLDTGSKTVSFLAMFYRPPEFGSTAIWIRRLSYPKSDQNSKISFEYIRPDKPSTYVISPSTDASRPNDLLFYEVYADMRRHIATFVFNPQTGYTWKKIADASN